MCSENRCSKYVFFLAVFVFFLAAYFNIGYYHPDEHYQLIEFANFKLGNTTSDKLAWEYSAMIRPALQPSICYMIINSLNSIGIESPYILALFLRMITGSFSLIAIRLFISKTLYLVNDSYRFLYVTLSYFLWFIPILSVRFSSETWSGICFLVALAFFIVESQTKKDLITGSLFLALSFLFRYQSGFLILGLVCWLVFIRKEKIINILTIAAIGIVVLQLGFLIDFWFYENYTCTFWNYFRFNIYYDVASIFGTAPWYTFISYIFMGSLWPIGTLITSSFLYIIFRNPKNVLIWCIIPFVFVHMIIPHKEIRFLFPIVWLVPIIIVLFLQEFKNRINLKNQILKYCLLILLFVLNFTALTVVVFKPAGNGEQVITKFIDDNYTNKRVHVFHLSNGNPFNASTELTESFYLTKNISTSEISGELNFSGLKMTKDTSYFLAIRGSQTSLIENRSDLKITKEKQSIPVWINSLRNMYDEHLGEQSFVLYKLYPNFDK